MGFAEDLKTAKADFEATFIDSMDVSRWEMVIDPVTRREIKTLVPKYTNQPCFISYSQQNNDNPNNATAENIPIAWKPLVFCKLDLVLLAGDEIKVTCAKRGKTLDKNKNVVDMYYEGKASDIYSCLTHTEFNLGIKTEA